MQAALTIAILLALSIAAIRIAAVAMRLTGLPENVARFQCISALTGTGFTTHESEMLVNYPIRRKILVALMIFGNLGLISVSATFIVAFLDAGRDADAIFTQAFAFVMAIAFILIVMMNRTLDRSMCAIVGAVLLRTTSLGKRRYQRLLQLDNGLSIAEHVFARETAVHVRDAIPEKIPLKLLAVRQGGMRKFRQVDEDFLVSRDDVLICYGSDVAHDAFEDVMAANSSDQEIETQ